MRAGRTAPRLQQRGEAVPRVRGAYPPHAVPVDDHSVTLVVQVVRPREQAFSFLLIVQSWHAISSTNGDVQDRCSVGSFPAFALQSKRTEDALKMGANTGELVLESKTEMCARLGRLTPFSDMDTRSTTGLEH